MRSMIVSMLAIGASTAAALAGPPSPTVSWSFSQSTTGNDVFWTSPTAVPIDADSYEYLSIITSVKVDVKLGILNFNNVDVTDEIDPEFLLAAGVIESAPPLTIFAGEIAYPEPPATPGVAANMVTSVDANGFGQLAVTDVTLGTVAIDLGAPFGVQNVTIKKISLSGTIDITPIYAPLLGDLNGDNLVDGADLGLLLAGWGTDDAPADLDGSGEVDGADLGILLGAWS